MIERIRNGSGRAFGFKVTGQLGVEDVAEVSRQIDLEIAAQKKPIGVLADLSGMHGATWAARWEEMRFLQRHTDHIARLSIVSDDQWEEIRETTMVAAASLQAETLYFHSSEMQHAWHWAGMTLRDEAMPVRVMYPGKGLFQDYTPEYMGI